MSSPTSTLIGHVFVDAVTRLVPRDRKKLTTHPIENGSKVAEHVADDECVLIMDCTFGDDEFLSGVPSPLTTAAEKRQAIIDIRDAKTPVNIVSIRDYFLNYVLLDIDEEVTPQNSKGFQSTLTFEKATLAALALTTLPVSKIMKKTGDNKTGAMKQVPVQDLGAQSAQELEDERAEAEAIALIEAVFG